MSTALGARIRYGLEKFQNRLIDRSARVTYAILGKGILFGPINRFNSLSKQPKSILILCQGNICRSPYAEKRLQALIPRATISKSGGTASVQIFSRGSLTTPGKPADPSAINFAKQRGIDLTTHRTTALDSNDIEKADLILIMDLSHRRAVKRLNSKSTVKTIFLGTFLLPEGKGFIVEDPFGSDAPGQTERFTQCYALIDLALTNLVKALR